MTYEEALKLIQKHTDYGGSLDQRALATALSNFGIFTSSAQESYHCTFPAPKSSEDLHDAADAADAARWRWLKMHSSVGEQQKIMSTPWGQWDAFADAAMSISKD